MIKASYFKKLNNCNLCPNRCNVDRQINIGKCRLSSDILVAKAYLHQWEEPVISGENGSGTIFFSGCTLGCIFCQNYKISRDNFGKAITASRLADIFKELEDKGANNINLVTATPHIYGIIEALNIYRPNIPIVFNSSGYENVDTIKLLDGYIDIYLPDFKYYDDDIAYKYSKCKNYRNTAISAIGEMIKQVGKPQIVNGIMQKGVIIRHMILPNNTGDSIKVIDEISKFKDDALISIMSQYTPITYDNVYPELNRKITKLEYKRVLNYVQKSGITNGFFQELDSAETIYIPNFDLEGV